MFVYPHYMCTVCRKKPLLCPIVIYVVCVSVRQCFVKCVSKSLKNCLEFMCVVHRQTARGRSSALPRLSKNYFHCKACKRLVLQKKRLSPKRQKCGNFPFVFSLQATEGKFISFACFWASWWKHLYPFMITQDLLNNSEPSYQDVFQLSPADLWKRLYVMVKSWGLGRLQGF